MSNRDFNYYSEKVKTLKQKPSDDELLKLYGLYKQSTIGRNCTPKPYFFNVVASKKWDIWNSHGDKDREVAQQEYVEFSKELINKYN